MSIEFNPLSGKFDIAPGQFVFIRRKVFGEVPVIEFRTLLQREPILEDGGGYIIDDNGEVLLV